MANGTTRFCHVSEMVIYLHCLTAVMEFLQLAVKVGLDRACPVLPRPGGYRTPLPNRTKHKCTILFAEEKFCVYDWECPTTPDLSRSLNWSPNKSI
jgi:hypothetical protein